MTATDQTPTILVSGEMRPTLRDEIAAIAPGADILCFENVADLEANAAEADIIATSRLSPEAFGRAKRLRWIHSWAAGPDTLLFPEMVASPVPLTCCKGNGAIPLAEHAMMLMLMLDRDVRRALAAQANHRWDRFYHGELNGRTCAIIGMGHSGQDLALKAKAFHMRVIGMRRSGAAAENFDAVFPRERLHEMLAQADFVVVTAPLTPETRGLLDAEAFAAMKPGAVYVCFSRGSIADDDALLAALREGRIAGAGLDAHAIEPLAPDSPFWDLPNVIVTPHHGALSQGTRDRGYEIFLDNLRRHLSGQPLVNLVDKAAGY